MLMTKPKDVLKACQKAEKFKLNEWYGLQSLLGNSNWAMFYILLGARDSGKSYAVMEYFLRTWKRKGIPFYWLRLNEASMKKMLANKAEKLVDPDLYRKYNLKLTVKGSNVYDHGKKMATVLALSTFANDKGTGLFDKDFLNDLKMQYHICLDEFQLENTQKSQGDIAYQFVQQLENITRDTKERVQIFLIGNTLEEASDILTLFEFIPFEFGRYKLKGKRAVIDYLEPSLKYKERRKGCIADLLMGNVSNFSNKIDLDDTLIYTGARLKPTDIICFKNIKFTIWDNNIISEYKNESCKSVIAMKPYLNLEFRQDLRDLVITNFDLRNYRYHNMITFKKFQKEIQLIKPRKA